MKTHTREKLSFYVVLLVALAAVPSIIHAQDWRLIAISGQQQDETQTVPGVWDYPDHTLFSINYGTGAITELFRTTWIPDSHSIGYCPVNGLVYHTGGSDAWTDNNQRISNDQGGPSIPGAPFQDNQYMETINVSTHAAVGVYNCNPSPNPDNAANEPNLPPEEQDGLYLEGFGLTAPIPPWVMPQYRRNTTQVAGTNRIQGPNEPGPIRGLAWSTDKNSFYVTDGTVLKMSADGMSSKRLTNNSAFLIPTDNLASYPTGFQTNVDSKAVAILKVGGVNKLFIGCRMDKAVSGNTNGWIMEVDPETGVNLGQIALNKPPGGALGGPDTGTGEDFGGLIALAQHPVTGVVYGIRKTDAAFERELVTIDLATGNTTLVGTLGMHLTSMAFVPAIQITKISKSGGNVTINWTGAEQPTFSLLTAPSPTGPWTTNVSGLTGPSTTMAATTSQSYYRIQKP